MAALGTAEVVAAGGGDGTVGVADEMVEFEELEGRETGAGVVVG
jgi:diacylglycerol kinase family enzyme